MENIKTLGELLQEIVENGDRYSSLFDFLDEENHFIREDIKKKLKEAEQKQFCEYMGTYNFVNSGEVYMAVCEYYEKSLNRPLYMGELPTMEETADNYIRDLGLEFEE